MSDREDDDYIGYGCPPRHGQFRKGQSGNPKGRPRKKHSSRALPTTSELDELQRAALSQVINVNEGGKQAKRTALDVVIRSQLAKAMKGHDLAQRDVLRRSLELEIREAQRKAEAGRQKVENAAAQAEVDKETFRYVVEFKEMRKKEWADAVAHGREEPDYPWPHPDDILIDKSRDKWHIRGPWDASSVPLYRWILAERDLAFVNMVLKARSRSRASGAWVDFWSVIWASHDVLLPLRWQIGNRAEVLFFRWCIKPMREVRNRHEASERAARRWRMLSGSDRRNKDVYKIVNRIMAPALATRGYRSLGQFERAYEDNHGGPASTRKSVGT